VPDVEGGHTDFGLEPALAIVEGLLAGKSHRAELDTIWSV
jgi:hypothetical protein